MAIDQLSFADAEYENKLRKTRRELSLEEMEQLLPWKKLGSKMKQLECAYVIAYACVLETTL